MGNISLMTPIMIFWLLAPMGIFTLVFACLSGKPAESTNKDEKVLDSVDPKPISDIDTPAFTPATAPMSEVAATHQSTAISPAKDYVPHSPHVRDLVAHYEDMSKKTDPRFEQYRSYRPALTR